MRRDADGGSIAAEFAVGVGVLVLPMTVLVLMLPAWIDVQDAARDAARQGARLAVHDLEQTTGSIEDWVADLLAGRSVEVADVEVLRSSERARVRVVVHVPAPMIPFAGNVGSFTLAEEHVEVIDPYRSRP